MVERMGKKIRKNLLLAMFVLLTALMLTESARAAKLALEGLNLWFAKMIPALLPFMILSGILIGLGLSDGFARLFSPLLGPVFSLSDSCLYCIVIGFLCGFPMGARVCAQSYEQGRISRREASLLLSFCNNIGPLYFVGYVRGLFPGYDLFPLLFGMYGIPLLYGIFLRHTVFFHLLPYKTKPAQSHTNAPAPHFFSVMNASIQSSLDAITVLGGYMIFCNLLNLIPQKLFGPDSLLTVLTGPLLEITSGLSRLSKKQAFWAFLLLPFGGLSCIAQTYSCIKNTDLSLSEYVGHKLIQTMLSALYYGFLFR